MRGADRLDAQRRVAAGPWRGRRRDTITAVAPSHGTSQSYRQNGVVIMRDAM